MENQSNANLRLGKSNPSRAAISNAGYLKWAAEQGGQALLSLQEPPEVQEAVRKVQYRVASRARDDRCFQRYDFKDKPSVRTRSRKPRPHPLTVEEKVDIVHQVLVKHQLLREVAQLYSLSISYVSALCKKAERNPQFLKELVD